MSSGDVVACVRGGPRGAALFREKGRIFLTEGICSQRSGCPFGLF
jgi:hypothetical protein